MEERVSGDVPESVRRPEYLQGLYLSYLLAGFTLGLLPLVRRLAGRAGVQTGPFVVLPVNAGVHALVRRFQRADGRTPRQRSVAGWFLVTWQLGAPVLASVPPGLVVMRGRSPLWGYLLNVIVGVSLDVLVRRRGRRRRSARP
ncbi:hypothetical protein SAMN05216574_102218 [Blastococcus tunisiensis]|uniref:Uncharacterized protein n=2 Tax=Blastococcus tunisiensis TaxID=1798228 RepID=A0A1I1XZV4_9ACTN|nr:hypothetical protein SAMN05216574_102218 [Blastococcus sp. DSM 46838]